MHVQETGRLGIFDALYQGNIRCEVEDIAPAIAKDFTIAKSAVAGPVLIDITKKRK